MNSKVKKDEFPDQVYIGTSWKQMVPFTPPIEHTSEAEPDMVNHPPHYQSKHGLEVIKVIEAFTDGLNGIEATDTGNVIKYICRWKTKNGLQDLRKAKWYLEHLINHIQEKENENNEN